ncbi:YolD-like family protein [Peribacillus cavernae]|uniref:YolD-like family protein n=1 Tax=Peribacillus cavernae TaxID=1674310 RepID=A0A3S0V8B3_9BACI|nr:YolD-like family protein [Peribacillus cavernae]MDQ0219075.1 hypothetical protein [Peribacillus cavernae]RUQ26526.1 YolD-like family protein [Peribacillus cavernae]
MRDRGSIKWTSMMLPEHKKMLADLYEEQKHFTKPTLDEQKLEELNDIVRVALGHTLDVKVTFYRHQAFYSVKGQVAKIDELHKIVRIIDDSSAEHRVPFEDIVNIEID